MINGGFPETALHRVQQCTSIGSGNWTSRTVILRFLECNEEIRVDDSEFHMPVKFNEVYFFRIYCKTSVISYNNKQTNLTIVV